MGRVYNVQSSKNGRYSSGSISNLSGQSFSTFSQATSISKPQLEGFTSGTSEFKEICQNSDSPGSVEEISSWSATEKFDTYHSNTMGISGQPEVNHALQKIAEQLSLGDEVEDYLDEKLPPYPSQYDNLQNLEYSVYEGKIFSEKSHERLLHDSSLKSCSDNNERQQVQSIGPGCTTESNPSPSLNHMLELSSNSPGISTHESVSNLPTGEDLLESSSCRTITLETQFLSKVFLQNEHDLRSRPERVELSENSTWQQFDDYGVIDPESYSDRNQFLETDLSVQLSAAGRFLLGSHTLIEPQTSVSQFPEVERLHSQGTSTLVGTSSDMSLGQENTIVQIGDNDLSIENGIYTSDLMETWLDPCQFENPLGTDLSLTVTHNQRFSIRAISPEWTFSSDRAKVIIIGHFLCNPSEFPWSVMFDDIEVPLEIVQEGVLRCQAPLHCAGRVSLCITSGNRVPCSEIQEFEFRAEPNTSSFSGTYVHTETSKLADELLLLTKFAKILFYGCDNSSVSKDGEYNKESKTADNEWQQIIDTLQVWYKSPSDTLNMILQDLLKDKFQQWLMSKQKGKDESGYLLSKQEQGIIHMISGLGYEWALNPILEFGVGINFRDSNGWTALHWAARFGRENMVAALLAAGSAAGAVTDPSPKDPIGKTPGDIAAASGHKGLAGYLSETALTSQLSSLIMEESEISRRAAVVNAESAVESISHRSVQMHVGGTEDELSLKDSLAAVRNASQAAALIQVAFRAHSFRKRREEAEGTWDEYGLTAEDILKLSAASKLPRSYSDLKFYKAALSIQKKYRGWKGRKDFLTLRQHVVKIQAIVRGHQMRKKYKEFLWTVGVLEKVVLRWRRKGVGLRGFQVELESIDESEDEDIVKVFRKQKVYVALDQAVSRVLSMVESAEARQQYHTRLASVEARILPPPWLKYHDTGREKDCLPKVGQWNMMNKKMVNGGRVHNWTCINFARNVQENVAGGFCYELAQMCRTSGMDFSLEPVVRPLIARPDEVERALKAHYHGAMSILRPQGKELNLLIVILPDNNGSLYGDLKRICETDLGLVSQCCLTKHVFKMSKQYLANVALKINVKVGGRNTVLVDALSRRIPVVSEVPTIIFGADVTHPHPGEDSSPSIAAVVASQDWPEITKYAGLVSAQAHRQELIQDLFKVWQDPQRGTVSGGMIKELLISFKRETGQKPKRIIFYRDGVSEGQFYQVLLYELQAIRQACAALEPDYQPCVTFVVVQKRHHTRLFANNHADQRSVDRSGNILPGTVVDSKICHPTEFDFYLCSHAGIQGTSRPAHYHVLWDENKFTADTLQSLTNNLCYTYARCTRSVSIVPPAYYAHLAAFRARFYLEPETSDSGSMAGTGRGGPPGGRNTRAPGNTAVKPLPALKENVKRVMFYC